VREGRTESPTCLAAMIGQIEPVSVAARAAPMPATGSIAILGLVDLKSAAFELLAVQRLHSPGCICIRHFDKAETARAPRVAIGDQRHLLDRSMRREQSAHAILSCGEGEISHVKFGHCTLPTGQFLKMTAVELCLLVRRPRLPRCRMRRSSSVSAKARKPKKPEPRVQYASSRPAAGKYGGLLNPQTDRRSRAPGQRAQRPETTVQRSLKSGLCREHPACSPHSRAARLAKWVPRLSRARSYAAAFQADAIFLPARVAFLLGDSSA